MPNFQRGIPASQPAPRPFGRNKTPISCFTALYDGVCDCGEEIIAGDEVGYIGRDAGGVSCNGCILDQEEKDRAHNQSDGG